MRLIIVSKLTNELTSIEKNTNFIHFYLSSGLLKLAAEDHFCWLSIILHVMLGCARVNFIIRRHANLRDE